MAYLLILTLFAAPLYVWRFNLAGLPLNFLLVWIAVLWLVFAVWLTWQRAWSDYIRYKLQINRGLLLLASLFVLAGVISLFYGGATQAKLGQFLVLFIQPLSVWVMGGYIVKREPSARHMFRQSVYLLVAVLGLLSIIQYFGLVALPEAYWGNAAEPKRAVGWFGHPDMLGLFLAPLLAWLVPDVLRRLDDWRQQSHWISVIAWLLGCAAILLSLSRGAWLGFAVAAIVGIIAYGRKRYWALGLLTIIVAALVIAAVPNWRYRVILPFMGEKSSVARFSLWHTGTKMVKDSPILGQGLTGFDQNWSQYNTDPNLDHYNFPHNIILNFWVDTGLLGVVSFVGIVLYGWWYALKNRRKPYALGLGLFLLAVVLHGLIDTPYLKNDLALIFWLIWGVSWETT